MTTTQLAGRAGAIRLDRDSAGVAQVTASEINDALLGLGYAHARDRGLQMLLMRILGRGQASEHLRADEPSLSLDRFFRALNFGRDFATEQAALSDRAKQQVAAYCAGANLGFQHHGVPWELRLLGYAMKNDPWSLADIFLIAKLMGYVALAQSQAEVERFIVDCVHHGLARARLEELFPGQLKGLDEALLRKVRLPERFVPESLPWASALPQMTASNNWAISGRKSASGAPLLANDPHLEVNRLPPIWYQAVLRWRDARGARSALGGTVPGVPALVIGRTADLAWGVTYAMADCVDSWIEDCRDGSYRRGEAWLPFAVRKETIRRKRKPPVEVSFYENEHGLLAGDPTTAGFYLATRWSCGEGTSASSVEAGLAMLEATSVEEGRALFGRLNNSSWNWVLADRAGNIGYQMAGRMPLRRAGVSGLVPLPGWDPANDWRGFASPEQLPRALNPPRGFLVTANDDLNHLGTLQPINLPMGPHRAERIAAVLAQEKKVAVEEMKRLQFDLLSTQAERFMAILKPYVEHLASAGQRDAQVLLKWDLRYDTASAGALVFERFYRALIEEVFGRTGGFGPEVIRHLLDETALFIGFFWNFDRVMLAKRSAWFGSRSREEVFALALAKALVTHRESARRPGQVLLKHLLFGGKLPRWLGFDRGPITVPGGRATVHQSQVYRSSRRECTFAPSLRFVADLATDELHANMPGGASDRCCSPWYNNGTADWLAGRYHVLKGPPPCTQDATDSRTAEEA
ncbi:MAG: penicillin acylase family protein [Verrucomicrobia bacterium]|nr:penicillin acylase family protein [Verrucomicrobiota bacterium]